MSREFTEFEQDQLKEVVNIGASHASTVLSKMVSKRVSISVPEVQVKRVEDVYQLCPDIDQTTAAVLLKMHGEVPGILLLMLSPEATLHISEMLTQDGKTDVASLDAFDLSAIQEAGNIIAGASLSALSRFLNVHSVQSVPEVVVDMAGAILNTVSVQVAQDFNEILAFRVTFCVQEADSKSLACDGQSDLSGDFFFLFDPQSTEAILQKMSAIA